MRFRWLTKIKIVSNIMKNFDPIGYTREKWSDPKHVKNRPYTCEKSHTFCNLEYEWGTETNKMKPINRPINPSLPNVVMPVSNEKIITVNYDSMTEENLDDWVAQSINRSLASMLNPQKKYFLPPQLEQELKQRYKKNKEIKKAEDETYFKSNIAVKKTKSYLNNDRKKKLSVNELCFDYKKLEPHQEMTGTPIKLREMKKVQKKQIRRRNAILLANDIHYARFLKQQNKQKIPQASHAHEQAEIVINPRSKIYSYNLESMNRSNCYQSVPCSLIEREVELVQQTEKDLLTCHRALMTKQDELHQKYRLMMNDKTDNAIQQIKQMASSAKQPPVENFGVIHTIFKKQISIGASNAITKSITDTQSKDKKYLESKVIKLLNDMQVQSESIDEDMAKLNIHVNEIFLQHPDARPQTKWILKAQQKIRDQKNLLAIDCYKQAIILQPELFIPVFNIAVLLEKENMFESARLWFNLAREFQTDSQNVLFGIALVAIKQLRYIECLTVINELIHKLQTSGKSIMPIYHYIRALCNKELTNYKDAKADYNLISPKMKPTNFNVLPNFIFSVVFGRHRRIHLQFNCLSYMLFREAIYVILYENQKKIREVGQSLVAIAQKIITGPFFCRFSLNLVRKLLKIATYQQKEKGEIIFNSKSTTSIIINGIVSLKSHEKQLCRPEMISILDKGGVIGAGQLENNISSKPNNWFIAESKVQLITVPRQDFEEFWKGQITFETDFKYNFLKNVDLFRGLSECTFFKLVQFFEKKTYTKGEILFNDCSYRIEMISKPGKGYGLSKNSNKADIRMVHSGSPYDSKPTKGKQRRERSKICQLIKKHIFKFNQMKFNRMKFPGLFVVTKGTVELEDDRGFRCNGMISERDFFGECLLFEANGYQNYGRMVAESEELEVLLLDIDKMVWLFNQIDKNTMKQNCKNRETIETVRFLRNRFMQCQGIKFQNRLKN